MYIHVKAFPKSKTESVVETKPGYFEMHIKEKAENNMANLRIVQILKDKYKTKNVRIINGHHSPSKLISVAD